MPKFSDNRHYVDITDLKYLLTMKVNGLDPYDKSDAVTISRLYEFLTGRTVSHTNPDNPNEVLLLEK